MRTQHWHVLLLLGPLLSLSAVSDQAPSYRLVERLRIGGDDDTVLTGIIPDIEVRDSTIFVLQPNAQFVARYDDRGRLLNRFGRRGSGPGEFQLPVRAGWLGDSLWIYDDGLRRVQLFDRTGTFVRTVPTARGTVARPLAAGSWLVEAMPTGSLSATYPILIAGKDGRVDTIARIRLGDEGVLVGGPGGKALRIRLPSACAVVAVSPTGSHIAIVEVADADVQKLRVRRFTADGRLVLDRLVPYEPIRATKAWYDSSVKEVVRAAREASISEVAVRHALPQPKFLSALQRAVTTSDGGLWIQRMVPPNEPTRILMLDSAGNMVGEAVGAPGLRLVRVESGQAFGINRTNDGSSYVVVLRLQRAVK